MLSPLLVPVALALAPAAALPPPAAPARVESTAATAPEMPLAPPPRAKAQRARHTPGDPLEGFNRAMFGIYEGLDKVLYRPAAMTYKAVIPKPVRTGLRHVLSNLTEPVAFVAYLLEGKPKRAGQTFARFAINSTVGLGGIIDVAKSKSVELPHHNNGLGAVLAVWGVKPGPYVFLPLLGPSSVRDLLGGAGDGLLLPFAVGKPFNRTDYQVTTGVIAGLDQRAENDAELKALFSDAVDRYATLRSVWQQNRAAEIDDLRTGGTATETTPELGDPLTDPEQTGKVAPPPVESNSRELSDPLEDPAGTATPEPAPAPAPSTIPPATAPGG